MWAFGYEAGEARHIWDRIPLDSDIIVTHTPPKYHCDEAKDRRAAGCEALREALWRVRPLLAICGHVHEARGVERVRWDLGASNIKFKEQGVVRWEDPGKENKKISLVDLSSKSEEPIRNDGSIDYQTTDVAVQSQNHSNSTHNLMKSDRRSQTKPTALTAIRQVTNNLLAIPPDALPSPTKGQGGIPPSQRCDLEALSGRMGRMETCVINAAIMASSWPHKTGGKKFNKPVVVDIDLPVSRSF